LNQQNLFKEAFEGITITCPSWLPDELREELAERGKLQYSFRFLKAERKAYRKEKPIKVSDWAEKNRVVTMSALPGPWKNNVTPYLVGIMDAIDYPSVREATICKCPQSGVSEAAHNYIGYCIDRKPGPVLYVFPDQLTAKENSDDRIQPMIEKSPRLSGYLTGRQDDKASLRINMQHMLIFLAWASSTSRLANKPIRYGVADEIDKSGFSAKSNETSALNLIRKRFVTFKNRSKFIKISTPTVETGNVWVELNDCEVIFDLWVVCPDCGHWQIMIFEQIKWDGGSDADPDEIINKQLAEYECIKESCKGRWSDTKRDLAVRMGEWRSRGKNIEIMRYLKNFNPRKIGFHLPSWYTRFVSLSECVESFLKGQNDLDDWKDFINAHKAEPYIPKKRKKEESRIKALKDDRPAGIVPGGDVVAVLTAGVDTQDYGFWYEIRAYGWGLKADSWQIRAGYVETFEALEQILWDDNYEDLEGNRYFVELSVQDAMGHRTDEVYDFCAVNRGVILPFKGEGRLTQPYTYSNIEFYPGTKKPIPGGLQLLRANVNYYKNKLSRWLDVAPGDPGSYWMNSEMTDDWAKQMTVEYVNEKGEWECADGVDNHAWDVSNYANIAYDVLQAKHWAKPETDLNTQAEQKTEKKKPKNKRGRKW